MSISARKVQIITANMTVSIFIFSSIHCLVTRADNNKLSKTISTEKCQNATIKLDSQSCVQLGLIFAPFKGHVIINVSGKKSAHC